MIIDIWDVGHGACSMITYSDGKRVMVDAGHRFDPFWAPSIEYYGQHVDMLVLQNLDEDHVANLPYVIQNIEVRGLLSNPTVDVNALRNMKREYGMDAGVTETCRLLKEYGPSWGSRVWQSGQVYGYPGWWHAFWNRHFVDFTETNNLSVPFFAGLGNFSILFGGDLEEAGWKALMRQPNFSERLMQVKILVASHHGRANGRCEEVFRLCRPEVVIISDYEHRHLSQQTVGWYGDRVNGIADNTVGWTLAGPQLRKVLTTRNDGSLRIVASADGHFTIWKDALIQGRGLLNRAG